MLLWHDRERASADVKKVALSHVAELEAKIAKLQAMAQTLRELASNCHGNNRRLSHHRGSGRTCQFLPARRPAHGGARDAQLQH
ncbi:MerR family DNA-binding protein [Stenotrophomonas sp. TWI602]|uniref:MerR family DNA-binding protein n=1 Tax=Stenotrophomonas sp. TWI602 TaxID=3136786 RepID=UPI0032091A79